MTAPDTTALTAFAGRLADAAAEVTLAHFRAGGTVDDKTGAQPGFDPVTAADREAEAAIRALIEAEYPDHGIRGEEQAAREGTSGYVWHIDPIDGTRSYVVGVPLWGTLIGLEFEDKPLIGVVDQPYLGERFIGSPAGAVLEGRGRLKPLAVSGCPELSAARLGTTAPDLFAPGSEAERYRAVEARARLTRYGGDCYFYAMLAAGHLDLVVEAGLQPYDIVAIIPVIEAAGGIVTTWEGAPANRGGQVVAAASAELHGQALALLSGS